MSPLPYAALAALMLASATGAAAQSVVTDEASGLSIAASDAWDARQVKYKGNDVMFGFNPRSGFPPIAGNGAFVCAVNFTLAPGNADLTQDEINAMISSNAWQAMTRDILETELVLADAEPFVVEGVQGVAFTGMPTIGEGAENVRLYLTMLETPRGRTAQTCVTTRAAFDDALPMFRELRDGISPPK